MMAMLSAIASFAVTDGQKYEPVNGYNLVNQWIYDRVHTTTFIRDAACNTRARTAVMSESIIYVARSEEKAVVVGNDTLSQSVIHRFLGCGKYWSRQL